MKTFSVRQNIGKARHVVSFHDGRKTHPDGSPFFDIRICRNKREVKRFTNELTESGYTSGCGLHQPEPLAA